MRGLNKAQYVDTVKLVGNMLPTGALFVGSVEAIDKDNRRMKINTEPLEIESPWCRVLQGAFCDKIGMEVIAAVVRGQESEECIVIGVIE